MSGWQGRRPGRAPGKGTNAQNPAPGQGGKGDTTGGTTTPGGTGGTTGSTAGTGTGQQSVPIVIDPQKAAKEQAVNNARDSAVLQLNQIQPQLGAHVSATDGTQIVDKNGALIMKFSYEPSINAVIGRGANGKANGIEPGIGGKVPDPAAVQKWQAADNARVDQQQGAGTTTPQNLKGLLAVQKQALTGAKEQVKADILKQIGNKPAGDLKATDKKPGEGVGSNLQSPLPGPSHEQVGGSGQFDKKFQSHRTGHFDKKIQSESPQQSKEKKKEQHFNVPARGGQFQNR